MNFAQAKQIRIEDFLKFKGIDPDRTRGAGRVLLYKSPYRNENTASLEVNTEKNLWYDHGDGNGGNIIDLVMKIEHTGATGALTHLGNINPNIKSFSFYQQKPIPSTPQNNKIEVVNVKPINSFALIQYLRKRKISYNLANRYLKEIIFRTWSYRLNDYKTYFSLGFKNDLGGYELRSSIFQGCTSKHLTLISGEDHKQLNIFEGFFDFLSAIELSKTQTLKFDSLILNSIAMKEKALDIICKYEKINLFMDNDPAGKEAASFFKKHHKAVKDFSMILYPLPYKDLNDYLMNFH